MIALVKPTKKPRILRGKCSARYPKGNHHRTGAQLALYIGDFDRLNSFRSGSVYIINGKEVRI